MLKYVLPFCVLLLVTTGIENSLANDEVGLFDVFAEASSRPSTTAQTTTITVGSTTTTTPPVPILSLLRLALRGYEYVEGFGFYKVNDVSRSWLSAKHYCENQGTHLAIINSEDEATNLRALMHQNGGSGFYWVGANDLEEEGNYLTILGTPLKYTGYNSWYPGDPNGKTSENCLAFYYGNDTDSGFIDAECTTEYWTLCELESSNGI